FHTTDLPVGEYKRMLDGLGEKNRPDERTPRRTGDRRTPLVAINVEAVCIRMRGRLPIVGIVFTPI
ncbi:MAG: hypothetical protein PPP58_06430, partial [Natronomonas sp.]